MLHIKNVFKTYRSSKGVTHRALEDVSMILPKTGFVFLLGKSGSGKSTLLNILGGLDEKDSGDILLNQQSLSSLSSKELDSYRNTYLGFVFQEHSLIPSLTVFENVALALDLQDDKQYEKIDDILNKLEIGKLKDRFITEISGGQRQRVSIARALVKDPKIILADEPTGSLDSQSSREVMDILRSLSKDRLVIIVTHDGEFATEYADRIIELKDGVVLRDLVLNDGSNNHATKMEVVASSIVKIPAHYEVNTEDLEQINEVVAKNHSESYLSIETSKDLVKAFFPHLRTAIEDSNINKDGRFRQFYQQKEEEAKPLTFKKTKLPSKRAFKFGLTNLKHKKVMMVLMLCISIISVSLFAVGESLSSYQESVGVAYSIGQGSDKLASIVHQDSNLVDESFEPLQEADFVQIENILENKTKVYRTYDQPLEIPSYKPHQELFTEFNGFIEINDIQELGFSYIAYDETLANRPDAVAISYFAAYLLELDNYVADIDDLVNPNHPFLLAIEGQEYCISAIIDTKDDEYKQLLKVGEINKELLAKHRVAATQYLYRFFVKEGFMSESFEQLDVLTASLETILVSNDKEQIISDIFYYDSEYAKTTYKIHVFNEANKETGYVIGIRALLKLLDANFSVTSEAEFFDHLSDVEELVNQYNQSTTYITSKKSSALYYARKNIPIFGVAYSALGPEVNTKLDSIGISKEDFKEVALRETLTTNIMVRVNHDSGINTQVYEILEENGYQLYSAYNVDYQGFSFAMETFGSTLKLVSLLLALVVAILLYGFISSTIKGSRQEIGILRALGARYLDILSIFALQTLFIGVISFVGAWLMAKMGELIINSIYSSSIGFSFLVLSIDGNVSFKMLLLTSIVVLLASIVPTRKLAKMRPVDVIFNRN